MAGARPGSETSSPIQHDRGRVSDQAYDYVRNAILRGELPVGAVLAEAEVAQQLGISRTPVRQALRRLLQEGLVTVGARRQLTVSGISTERRRETFIVRGALERVTVTEACRVIDVEEIDQLRLVLLRARRAAQAQEIETFIDLDEQFHLGIAEGARLPVVVKFLEQLRAFVRMMGLEAVSRGDRMMQVVSEHDAVLNAIEARDVDAAVAAMEHHLHVSREVIELASADVDRGGEGDG